MKIVEKKIKLMIVVVVFVVVVVVVVVLVVVVVGGGGGWWCCCLLCSHYAETVFSQVIANILFWSLVVLTSVDHDLETLVC